MAVEAIRLDLQPPKSGVTLRRFLASDKPVRAIMGPVGSAKTTTCLTEILRRAVRQAPSPIDGVRRTRFAVVRDTYRNLEKTTIPSWFNVVPRHIGEVRGGGGGEPMTHRIRAQLPGLGEIEVEVIFIAIGDHNVEDILRGLELTGAYLNEGDRLAREVLFFLRGRVGRYPSPMHGGVGCTWSGVWLDLNAPDVDSYVYELFVEQVPDGFEFFRQPGGRSPQAENIENLPANYYQRQCEGQPDWYVRRMVDNEFGYSREGMPVYQEFSDTLHVAAQPILPIRNRLIRIGLDAGLTPAALAAQSDLEGQVRWLDEFVPGRAGARAFGEMLASWIAEKFPRCDVVGVSDPSSVYETDTSEASWTEIVAATAAITIVPAPTNNLTARLEAVRQPMQRMIGPHKPGFLISPSCKIARRGLNSEYRFRRVKIGGTERYEDRPEKNSASHVQDAGQYATLELTGYAQLMERRENTGRTVEELDFDPLRP